MTKGSAVHDYAKSLQRVAGRTQRWRFHCWYWGDAIAIDGLLEADPLGASGARAFVVETLERWVSGCPDNFDDALGPLRAAVELAIAGEVDDGVPERLKRSVDRLPTLVGVVPALEPHRPRCRFGACVDALYHLPPGLALFARWRGDGSGIERALRMAEDHVEVLGTEAGGITQWFDVERMTHNGAEWTRGFGWALLGLLDLIEVVGDPGAERLGPTVTRLLERLGPYQDASGDWPTVLDIPGAERERSTAAFYVAATLHPALAALDLHAPEAARAAAVASLTNSIDEDGTVHGHSADVLPSWDIATYLRPALVPSPWAQGAALRALAALNRAGDGSGAAGGVGCGEGGGR